MLGIIAVFATLALPSRAALAETTPEIVDDRFLNLYGEALFKSTALSFDGTISCSSCHSAAEGLSGITPTAIGISGQVGSRRAPALVNLYASGHLMWDGAASSLQQQIPMPLQNTIEMAVDWVRVSSALGADPGVTPFRRMFGEGAFDKKTIVAALADYVGSLVSGNSPFDRYFYAGEEAAMSESAKRGLRVFARKARCVSCHLVDGSSAMLTDDNFHSIGVGWDGSAYKDLGRAAVSGDQTDAGKFKTPTLRNVAERPYLMHDGSMTTLREVVDYYNRGGNDGAANKDGRIIRLYLSPVEIDDLVAFLKALSAPIQSYDPAAHGGIMPLGLAPPTYRQSKIQ